MTVCEMVKRSYIPWMPQDVITYSLMVSCIAKNNRCEIFPISLQLDRNERDYPG